MGIKFLLETSMESYDDNLRVGFDRLEEVKEEDCQLRNRVLVSISAREINAVDNRTAFSCNISPLNYW